MTKEELFEALDFNTGDMVFVVRVRDTGKGFTQQRINHGMHPYMLIGVADIIREEVMRQIAGDMKPRVIETERTVIE